MEDANIPVFSGRGGLLSNGARPEFHSKGMMMMVQVGLGRGRQKQWWDIWKELVAREGFWREEIK